MKKSLFILLTLLVSFSQARPILNCTTQLSQELEKTLEINKLTLDAISESYRELYNSNSLNNKDEMRELLRRQNVLKSQNASIQAQLCENSELPEGY